METHLNDRDRIGVQDAVLLEDYTSEKAFVNNLKKRFEGDIIYTYIGHVLISVNPYKELNIYGSKDVAGYNNKHFFEVPPHVFAITDTAYRSLRQENREQCILISGESGSGKTEASKKVLQYIAEVTDHRGEVEKVKDKLLLSNPVLEAFGNAKTNRNDNSSRFGKYMDVQFNFEGNPVGGNILNYLLEKSRLISQVEGERNFHIFYQLLAGADGVLLDSLELSRDAKKYFYLTNGEKANVNTIHDDKTFREVSRALNTLEFSENEQKHMFSIIAGILHLGNVKFSEDNEKSLVSNDDLILTVSQLLNCNRQSLTKALTHRTIETKRDVAVTPLNKELAIYARDALAKAIYDRLFTWLVKRLNSSLQPEAQRDNSVMGILDIYGFEIFEKNSFEQICINFCNEKLQQLFIDLTLKSEQEEYEREGIQWQAIEYFDNKIICDIIEEKHKGLIAYLDEECLRPGDPTDKTLLAKLNRELSNHKHYVSHEKAGVKLQKTMGRDEFQLIHYAGAVTYNVKGFIEKNNDLLFRDLRETMIKSTNPIIQKLFLEEELSNKKRPDTAITQFKNSVNNLMTILRDKEPSYIRCIKPNNFKHSGDFDEDLVTHQVTYLGLMENLRVRRAGFAYRRLYELFLQRYKCLSKQTWPHYNGPAKDGVQILVNNLGFTSEEYQMGKTKIFIRYPQTLFRTEDAFQLKKHDLASIIQANWKGLQERRRFLKMRQATIFVQKYVRRFIAIARARRRRQAVSTIRKFITGFITRDGEPTDLNKSFMGIAKVQWLNRLAKSLPNNILQRTWPKCPFVCKEASAKLEIMYGAHMSRVYRLKLSPERKIQLEMKVLAESLFKGHKKSYEASIREPFIKSRVKQENSALVKTYVGELYSADVQKFDRHGYKMRERTLVLTTKNIHLLEVKGSVKPKHCLPLSQLSFVVTKGNDRLLLIRLPEDLMKKDKGDLILQVPNVIEVLAHVITATKNNGQLQIVDNDSIEHSMKQGKHGTIEVKTGNPEAIHKDKSGHLLIVASP